MLQKVWRGVLTLARRLLYAVLSFFVFIGLIALVLRELVKE